MTLALAAHHPVAVIGAGTMGAGIALVAARAGHRVLLHDADPAAIARGIAGLAKILDGQVAKGRIDAAARDAQLARIEPATAIDALAPAKLVIEAIVENIDIKAKVLAAVEAVVADDAIVTSNTSSLSITALAARLARPERVAGMHFFNPAPVLPLVEVVGGHATDPAVVDAVFDTAAGWGKVPVRCRSTPGFIVNRVARPFYGEALRLLAEGAADAATVDAILRDAGGFRMGAFELMDMIGHDVNFAVTSSVHAAMFGDPRYRPSLVQKDLVDAGWLGRKSGRGFYDYRDGAAKPAAADAPPAPPPAAITIAGDLGPAAALAGLARDAGIAVTEQDGDGEIVIGDARLALTDGRLATTRGKLLFDLALDYGAATRIAVAAPDGASAARVAAAAGFFQALGKAVAVIDDAPGLVVARTVAMLINEAADALHHRVATAPDIDLSMTKGVNYPAGPLAWCDRIGAPYAATMLDMLALIYGEERYRCSPLLRRKALTASAFLPD